MGKYLSYDERRIIEAYLKINTPVKVIAVALGRSLSTVYKEINRGQIKILNSEYQYIYVYSSYVAQQRFLHAQTSKGCPIKLSNDYEFAHFIEQIMIKEKYSPAAALVAAKRHGFKTKVSVNTLYHYIDRGYFLHLSNKHLMFKGAHKPRQYNHVKSHVKPLLPHIEDRPFEASSRQEVGHWEMDCVCGKSGTSPVLLVLTERVTRYELIFKMPDKTTHSVIRVLNRLERAYPDFKSRFKSITVDNGSEFADYTGMIRSIHGGLRTQVFYCHPYTACERGSNENCNRIIRRWVPKGSDISKFNSSYIQQVQDWINNYPRFILGYESAADYMKACFCA